MFKTRQTAQPMITKILISSVAVDHWTFVTWCASSLPTDKVRTPGGAEATQNPYVRLGSSLNCSRLPITLGGNLRHWDSGVYEIRSPFQSHSAGGVEFVIYGSNFSINRDSDQSLARVVW